MKKWFAMLLALVLLLGLAIPAMAETKLISVDGYEAYATFYTKADYEENSAYIRINMRVKNGTNQEIFMVMEDVMVDGTPVNGAGAGRVKAGETQDDYLLLSPTEDNPSGSAGAIRTGETVDATLRLVETKNYSTVGSQSVHIDLNTLSYGDSAYVDPDTADDIDSYDFGHGNANSGASYAPAYTPASYDFQTLQKGSKGQAVRDLQQRLTDLGYLNDKVDGSFGLNTATAVMSFNAQNGFYINGTATPEMQSLLYSSSAQYYIEPWIPLIIGPEYKWDNPTSSNDIGWFYVQLANRCNRTVRGYELYYYMTDMWGKKITVGDNNAWLYPSQHQQTIQPGYLVYDKAGFAVTPFAYTYSVYVGVHKIVFDDGEIREAADDEIIYFECPVKK